MTADTADLIKNVNVYKSLYAQFDKDVSAYNSKKDAYNTAIDTETKRRADFFAAAFSPATSIPERPCPPSQPPAYMGPNLDLSNKTWKASTVSSATTDMAGKAVLKIGTANTPDNANYNRIGWYEVAVDKTKLTEISYTGKVWGRLGQGAGNMPASSKPFYWAPESGAMTAGNSATMVISAFPEADGDAGLDDAKKFIKFEAKAVPFEAANAWATPTRPNAADSPKPGLSGAKMLAAGVISAAAAIASLY